MKTSADLNHVHLFTKFVAATFSDACVVGKGFINHRDIKMFEKVFPMNRG